jgi:hypothetical protein
MVESKDTEVKKPRKKPSTKKAATASKTKATAVKKPRKKTATKDQQIQEEIAKKAYELYEESGRQDGRDVEHWLEAEQLLKPKRGRKKAS